MDLANLDLGSAAEEGAYLNLVHPISGEELEYQGEPIRIFLKGNDSDTFKKRLDFHMRKDGKRRGEKTIAEVEQQSCDLLAHVTTGWENVIWEDEPLEFSIENAKMLYKQRPWIRRQVDEFVAEAENFFSTNSKS